MKTKVLAIVAFLFTIGSVSAQSMDNWPALKAFHGVMSQTFHPAEEGNLEPIKARSEEMMNKAAQLLKVEIPAEFRTDAIIASAERLQLKSTALNKIVKSNAADAAVVKSITDLHDTFHEIVGLCSETKK